MEVLIERQGNLISIHHAGDEHDPLVFDIEGRECPLGDFAACLVEYGLVDPELVRSTSRAAEARTEFVDLEPAQQAFIDLLVEVEWCRTITEQGVSDYDA
ncbi:MAG: hypothetical protein AAGF11_50120 [Myxococcota bacterium]